MGKRDEYKYVFKGKSDFTTHYIADAYALSCADFRGKKIFEDFLGSMNIVVWDPNSPPGGLRVFASPLNEHEAGLHLQYITMLHGLHHFEKIIMVSHTNCGGYGGLEAFNNDKDKEFEFHLKEHEKARAFLKEKSPDLEVETYFIDEEGIKKTG